MRLPFSSFLAELQRRKVHRVALAYAAVSIGVVEGADAILPRLSDLDWVIDRLALLAVVGFPVALVLAWLFQLNPERPAQEVPSEASEDAPGRYRNLTAVAGWVLALLVIALTGLRAVKRADETASILTATRELDEAVEAGDWTAAFIRSRSLPLALPDSTKRRLGDAAAVLGTLLSEPAGATVSWRPFDQPDAAWEVLGKTPFRGPLPRGTVAVRLSLEGHVARIIGSSPANRAVRWRLASEDDSLPNGLHIPGGQFNLRAFDWTLGHAPAVELGDYILDRFEVTNAEFDQFVEAGGYDRPGLWTEPFTLQGRTVTWQEAMEMFVDATQRPGPATWRFGTYPEGTEHYPVTGVSWHEASAYARFVGRHLPTLYHWYAASGGRLPTAIIPHSNIEGDSVQPVGTAPAVSPFGASDMAGNAREWVVNAGGALRYTVGGGWDDPPYTFSIAQPQDAFDRSPTNGFRLVSYGADGEGPGEAGAPVERLSRDFYEERPVSDPVYAAFLDMYRMPEAPLNATLDRIDTLSFATRERITFDAGYDDDSMVLYLFRPLEGTDRAFQVVAYFPGSGALRQGSDIDRWSTERGHVAFLVRSGRAVAFPVFKSTFDREDDYAYRMQDLSNDHRDHVLKWRQDLGRSLDYLETRDDLDADKLGYFGFSWGGRMGPIMLATEPRFDAGVLYVAGLSSAQTQPVVDPFNFASRVDVPVLMLSGQYDQVYPLETAARPLFQLLGTEVKRHVVAAGGHYVPREQLVRESVAWLDRHLGAVER